MIKFKIKYSKVHSSILKNDLFIYDESKINNFQKYKKFYCSNASCNDILIIFLKLNDMHIEDIKIFASSCILSKISCNNFCLDLLKIKNILQISKLKFNINFELLNDFITSNSNILKAFKNFSLFLKSNLSVSKFRYKCVVFFIIDFINKIKNFI